MIRMLRMLVATVALSGLAGCAATGPAMGDDVMVGLDLKLFVRRGENAFALYRVSPDGMLSFAGGYDAVNREYTWTGPLTATEREELRALIRVHEWFATPFVSTSRPPQWGYRIDIQRPGEGRRFAVEGQHPRIEPVRELLETAAARRNEEFMRSLPKPGLQE
jgi:hypothetical protein